MTDSVDLLVFDTPSCPVTSSWLEETAGNARATHTVTLVRPVVRTGRSDRFGVGGSSTVGRSWNAALAATTAPLVCCLRPVVRLGPSWLRSLAAPFRTGAPRLGAVGPLLGGDAPGWQGVVALSRDWHLDLPLNEIPQGDLVQWGRYLRLRFPRGWIEIDGALHFSCILLRRSAIAAIGGFDDGYLGSGTELDLCYQLAARGHGLGLSLRTYALLEPDAGSPTLEERTMLRRDAARLQERWPLRFGRRAS